MHAAEHDHRELSRRRRPGPLHAIAFAATAAAALYAIARLARLVARVATQQEALLSTFDDLSRAVLANASATNELIADFQTLRDQLANLPTDRPINAEEQAALDAAVAAIEARTAAILAVDPPDPSQPVLLGHRAGTQGGVVEMTDPAAATTAPAAEATDDDAEVTEPDPGAGAPVTEPAPPAPLSESPGGGV